MMKLFTHLYFKTMQWANHRSAFPLLCWVSFIEAIFFPIPPDVMLIPMSISKPHLAWKYAIYTTLFSIIGGIIGYSIGYFAYNWVEGLIQHWGYYTKFAQAKVWFEQWGIAIIFLAAGFTPIPFKIFTVCAGVTQMSFLPFMLAAIVSRFSRFLLVAKLSAWGGEKYANKIQKYIEYIGWAILLFVAITYIIYQL